MNKTSNIQCCKSNFWLPAFIAPFSCTIPIRDWSISPFFSRYDIWPVLQAGIQYLKKNSPYLLLWHPATYKNPKIVPLPSSWGTGTSWASHLKALFLVVKQQNPGQCLPAVYGGGILFCHTPLVAALGQRPVGLLVNRPLQRAVIPGSLHPSAGKFGLPKRLWVGGTG